MFRLNRFKKRLLLGYFYYTSVLFKTEPFTIQVSFSRRNLLLYKCPFQDGTFYYTSVLFKMEPFTTQVFLPLNMCGVFFTIVFYILYI